MVLKVNGRCTTYQAAPGLHPLPLQARKLSLDDHSGFLVFETIPARCRYVLLLDVRATIVTTVSIVWSCVYRSINTSE